MNFSKFFMGLMIGSLVFSTGQASVQNKREVTGDWDGAGNSWTCSNCGESNYCWQMSCSNCGNSQ